MVPWKSVVCGDFIWQFEFKNYCTWHNHFHKVIDTYNLMNIFKHGFMLKPIVYLLEDFSPIVSNSKGMLPYSNSINTNFFFLIHAKLVGYININIFQQHWWKLDTCEHHYECWYQNFKVEYTNVFNLLKYRDQYSLLQWVWSFGILDGDPLQYFQHIFNSSTQVGDNQNMDNYLRPCISCVTISKHLHLLLFTTKYP